MRWLPPEEYVRTLPNATMYAALYFTDTGGDPFALRSAHGVETWQFPGGNVEHGDTTPFATAVRECREETGIEFGGPPTLLLTHFIPPRPGWPCAKIGFVFDGGVLTSAELDRIVLDASEHTDWLVQPLGTWKTMMSPRLYTRIHALHEARKGRSAAFLSEP
ncbi:NUDIX domain-containing protein [Actinomadura sp. NEAU-AAG7]|uniref:NUDIX domain-containing protein n=1 Tax=Actinomadura sp. NEAU-AAG7 TaxID=2839640 RepID=UPI001BE44080|nr:NUDIX hydrolase [Actinomadura sp. NEAU-AAG7]MBT2213503.1 NUDIX hydrolase [Actinomadura sp. NEAU-AAG7]